MKKSSGALSTGKISKSGALPNMAGNTEGGDNTISIKGRLLLLEKDLERRQESYVTRERAYKAKIDELEEELAIQREKKTGWMKSDVKLANLKNMQYQIIDNVSLVQDRTAKILQEQERDLLRAFRARLFDLQTELEKEKSKKDDGAGAWMEKSRQLEAELEWSKEVADRLERVNQTLTQENDRLKSQFKSQDDDRNFLIKQLVAVKKDNARLRIEFGTIQEENATLTESIKRGQSAGMGGGLDTGAGPSGGKYSEKDAADALEADVKYKDINKRIRRLLADERRALQAVRQNYARELQSRTELELLLRKSVEDVRKEIARKHAESAQYSNNLKVKDLAALYAKDSSNIPIEEFTQEERQRSLEILLSQERVVTLLYAKTFPVSIKQKGAVLEAATPGSAAAAAVARDSAAAARLEGSEDDLDGGGGSDVKFPEV
jgi:hypothetical protein